MKNEEIAKIAHEVNRAYCESIGDRTQKKWDDAPDWQKRSAINGVEFTRKNPNSKPSDSHKSWLEEKRKTGWKYGKVKDEIKKTHPCFVPYSKLPLKQKIKDSLFQAVVKTCLSIQ